MEAKPGISITHLQGPALTTTVDLLAFVAFGDPSKDGTFKAVDQALGGVLADVAKSESFDGKANQSITVHTHGRIPAKRVMVIGAGARNEFGNPNIRDVAASIAQTANRVGAANVAFVLPSLSAARE